MRSPLQRLAFILLVILSARCTFAQSSPSITSVTPPTGVAGLTQVTVTGSGFGDTQGSSGVIIGTDWATVSSWSDTQIVATAR